MNKTVKIFIGVIVGLIVVIALLSIGGGNKKIEQTTCYKKAIIVWSPLESRKIRTQEIVKSLKKYCLTLNVQKKTLEQIKDAVLSEIASGKGPDVIFVDSDFLLKNKNIFASQSGKKWFNLKDYPNSIQKDFGEKTIAYPLTYDTLVLFWNKDLLNSIGYTQPPESFEGLLEIIPKLRKMDLSGQIILSPIALGSSQNINSSFETFLAMMKMLNPDTKKTSGDISKALYKTLDFYTQFTSSKSEYFSWHPNLSNQRDAFLSEQTAMIVDFYSFKNEIKKRNPRFNFEIAPFLQFESNPKKTNYIEPYFFAVTKKSSEIGWLFLEIFDSRYDEIAKDLELNPIKINTGKNAEGVGKILFNEMIVGDNFSEINKDYIKPYIKEDIENWLSNQRDIKQLINSKQASKFYNKK